MRPAIHVINASSRSDTGITRMLAQSLAWADLASLPEPRCVTLEDGPNGITTARDSDLAAPAVLGYIERMAPLSETAGFVVACFSDPGVYAARGLTRKPVIGIGEAGFSVALSLGDRIGTIGVAVGRGDKAMRIARHMGALDRVAGHRGLGLDYAQLQDPSVVTGHLIRAGLSLRDEAGAEALLFTGAGLCHFVKPLEEATGLPVVDPTTAAYGMALAQAMQRSTAKARNAGDR